MINISDIIKKNLVISVIISTKEEYIDRLNRCHELSGEGKRKIEEWRKDGYLHREDGPAYIQYYSSNKKRFEYKFWYINGKVHREDGPACILYDRRGNEISSVWFINDIQLNDIEIEKIKQKLRLKEVFDDLEIGDLL